MKKLGFIIMPLMTGSFLASCNGGTPKIETFTVTFDANGGTLDSGAEATKTVDDGTLFYDIAGLDNQKATHNDSTNFKFAGWGLTDDTQTKIGDTYKITDDVEVFAIYKPIATAKVTFDETSTNCRLYLEDETECVMGHPVIIPAGIDIKLTIEPNDGYLPIFKDNLTVDDIPSPSFVPSKKEITINVAKDANCSIKATTTEAKGKLNDYSWSEINEISENGVAPLVFNVGDDKLVNVNNKLHRVRIIGFNHDELASSPLANPEFAGITFEFANFISDSNGFSLATLWNWENETGSTNENYLNSNLRKAIDGGGSQDTHLNWYQKNGTKTSENYKTSVLDMITSNPDNVELKDALKEVRKPIAIKSGTDYVVDKESYVTKLFPLSYREMTEKPSTDAKDEGKTYEFYKGEKGDTDDNRIKWQVNHRDGAITMYTEIIEDDKTWKPWSYAGYNSANENHGGTSWLRSPNTNTGYSNYAWRCYHTGNLARNVSVYDFAFAVAPAFCI